MHYETIALHHWYTNLTKYYDYYYIYYYIMINITVKMNSHFALCGHRLAAKLPHSEKHYSDYLTNRNVPGSFAFHLVESDEIITEIMALPSNKSYGLYSCPSKLLKRTRHILCVPLAKILNNSVERGIYPEKLKIAKVVPIFKPDDETDTNNYRPISLLSIFTIIFEKLMHKRLSSYLDINKIYLRVTI